MLRISPDDHEVLRNAVLMAADRADRTQAGQTEIRQ